MKRTVIVGLTAVAAVYELARWSLNPVFRRDFVNYWLAPRAAWNGVDPYNVDAFVAFAQGLLPGIWPEQVNFAYPPHSLFLFAPFSLLPLPLAFLAWNAVSAAFFCWAVRPFLPKGLPVAIVLLLPASLINLRYGQTGLVSAGLFLTAFRPNGVAAAMLTFKPHLGFLVIPALLRDRRSLAIAVLLAVALVVFSELLLPGSWASFFGHAAGFQGPKLAGGTEGPWLFKATTPMVGYGLWGWLLFAAGGAYFLWRNFTVFTTATATFLIAPYGLHYDMAAVCLGFLILLHSHWETMPPWQRLVAAAAFLTPLLVDLGTWLVSPILLLGLAIQAQWMRPQALGNRGAQGHSAHI